MKALPEPLDESVALIAFLQDLIRIRSICGLDGEKAVTDRILQEADTLGLSCHIVAKDPMRPNAIVSTSPEGPTLFCFVAHIDTVDVGDRGAWKHGDPFGAVIEGDQLYGRGACDCKGGVAVSMYALKRLQASLPPDIKGHVSLLCVVDEESGACSPLGLTYLLDSGAVTHSLHGSIYAYPGRVVTIGHRGLLRLEVKVKGYPVHSGSSDWAMRRKGANAISGLCRLLAALEAEAWDSNTSPGFPDLPFTLTPTILKGGTFESIVPESASALLDLRLPPHVDAEEILSRISTIVQRTMEQGGDGCEASVDVRVRLPAYQIPTDHPLATTCADVVQEVTGTRPPIRGCGPANEGYMLGQAGIACICGFGPIGGNVHGVDEWVEVGDSMRQTLDIYTAIVMRLVQGGSG